MYGIKTLVNRQHVHRIQDLVVVAQWLEHLSYSQGVEGSIPSNDYVYFFQPHDILFYQVR